jgi:hypothetical protein
MVGALAPQVQAAAEGDVEVYSRGVMSPLAEYLESLQHSCRSGALSTFIKFKM